jgi:hypothetical protein
MDWEQRYETGDTPWEKGAPAPPLLEWLESRGSIRGDILVPGCGSGHDVRAIAAPPRVQRSSVWTLPRVRSIGLGDSLSPETRPISGRIFLIFPLD